MTPSTAPIAHRSPRPRAGLRRGLLGAAALLLAAGAAIAAPLDRELLKLAADAKLGSAVAGVAIYDATTGEELGTMNERRALTPASNLKLLTSGTALLVLGPDFEFRTRIVRDGDRIVVIGAGDPAFGDSELLGEMKVSANEFVDRLAQPIIDAGGPVREVIIDDRVFDREAVHPTWPKGQLHRWYCAEVSGLNFHANVIEVFATCRSGSGVPSVRKAPDAPWLEMNVTARCAGKSASTTLDVQREPGFNRFTLSGTLVGSIDEPIRCSLTDPALVFGRLLADRLHAAGLDSVATPANTPTDAVPGGAVAPAQRTGIVVRLAEPSEVFNPSKQLAVVRTPLQRVLERCNVDSHNLYAEALLKRIGREVTGQPGSWSNGTAVVRMQVNEKLGTDSGSLLMVDGSGMSAENTVSPMLMARWLVALNQNERVRDMFVESLPKPGEGTLRRRFQDRLPGEVRAKSGFINNVRAFSGYVTSVGGRRVAYSIIINNTNAAPPGKVVEFSEDAVAAIARYLDRQERDDKPAAPARPAAQPASKSGGR
jgi:D-alanyl-D-alanine carboxypeptidase/D-alanyl-D-alanine-endopeptidase (penicillin-binding protein 4)